MTSEPAERASIQSWRFALAMMGGALVAASIWPMIDYFGGGDKEKGFQMAMIVLSSVAVLCFIVCFLFTRDGLSQKKQQMKITLKNRLAYGRIFASRLKMFNGE
jgi:GPH family glycoside/pentoside/hexuronide:cation symporter